MMKQTQSKTNRKLNIIRPAIKLIEDRAKKDEEESISLRNLIRRIEIDPEVEGSSATGVVVSLNLTSSMRRRESRD